MPLKSLLLLVAVARAKVYPTANETYTSILYAPSPSSPMHKAWGHKRLELTCIVAAQGLQLAALDPARDRVLLVNEALAAEADTRALLEAAACVKSKIQHRCVSRQIEAFRQHSLDACRGEPEKIRLVQE